MERRILKVLNGRGDWAEIVVKALNTPRMATATELARDCYEFGEFRLDCRTRELRRAGKLQPLTPKAFDLLQVLVSAGGGAVEKIELMKRVWPDSFVSDDSLTHNVATIRKALGDQADRPRYIVTVPRYGYRFTAPVRLASEEPEPTRPLRLRPTAAPTTRQWLVLLTMIIVTATVLFASFLQQAQITASVPMRFTIAAPEGTTFSQSASFLAVSPNGRLVAFLASRPGAETRLWVRPVDSLAARELAGTDGALSPFWSPDSQSLGFVAHGQLKTVSLVGGLPRVLCEVQPGIAPSATWSRDGIILFSHGDAIYRISASGGVSHRVTEVDQRRSETAHLLPHFLPDGRHFIFVARGGGGGSVDTWIVLASLDGTPRRHLIRASSQAVYDKDGYLLFLDNGTLRAQPFDPTHLDLRGAAVPVADTDEVGFNPATPRGMFSISQTGLLAYRPASKRELGWYDRTGRPLGWIGVAGRDFDPALSPDGRHVAVSRFDPKTSIRSIWILDARSGVGSPLTSQIDWARCPLWSLDGSRILFGSRAASGDYLYEKRVGESAEARVVARTAGCAMDWLPRGDLLYEQNDGPAQMANGSGPRLWQVSFGPGTEPKPLTGSWPTPTVAATTRLSARVSPNGRWIAYVSNVSGRNEVYLRSLSSERPEDWHVSGRGGIEPQWRADSRELFFVGADKQLMSVPIMNDGRPGGVPTSLFMTDLDPHGLGISGRNQYAVSPSGEQFLLNQSRPGASSPPVNIVLNWTAALKN